jgi:hydroxyquinol 1,2-dioxygenase
VSYEVPTDGPGGALLEATGRHAWRPSHLHFIVKAEGYRTLVSEVFAGDDPYLDQDAVFGVREDLVMSYKDMPAGTFPEGYALSGQVAEAFLQVDFDLTLVRE